MSNFACSNNSLIYNENLGVLFYADMFEYATVLRASGPIWALKIFYRNGQGDNRLYEGKDEALKALRSLQESLQHKDNPVEQK